ncbi:TIGR02444 family protein [Ramlibacter sp. PS3R-8]|uniref:TIGR02444 family protein n=1 Tax=Ramlibacter sp. PS3R-8 TaxID=3133437 RepID=UPI00309D8178
MTDEQPVNKQDAWDFIVARYRDLTPHESKHLHALQDEHGLDIVLHLFQEYSALRLGRPLTPDEVAAAESQVAGWRSEVILPLRRLRRTLKDPSGFAPGQEESVQALRVQIAQAELDAEQAELYALCDWLSSQAWAPTRASKNAAGDLKRESRTQYASPSWPW